MVLAPPRCARPKAMPSGFDCHAAHQFFAVIPAGVQIKIDEGEPISFQHAVAF